MFKNLSHYKNKLLYYSCHGNHNNILYLENTVVKYHSYKHFVSWRFQILRTKLGKKVLKMMNQLTVWSCRCRFRERLLQLLHQVNDIVDLHRYAMWHICNNYHWFLWMATALLWVFNSLINLTVDQTRENPLLILY